MKLNNCIKQAQKLKSEQADLQNQIQQNIKNKNIWFGRQHTCFEQEDRVSG